MTGTRTVPEFRKVTCYECISPEPVENFAYNAVKKALWRQLYKGKISIVNNTERFTPKKRVKALKKLGDSVVAKDGIVYPFWENASRMVEVKLSFIYGGRRLLLAIPLITLIWLIIVAYRAFMRKKEGLRRAVGGFVSAKWRLAEEKCAQTARKTRKRKLEE